MPTFSVCSMSSVVDWSEVRSVAHLLRSRLDFGLLESGKHFVSDLDRHAEV